MDTTLDSACASLRAYLDSLLALAEGDPDHLVPTTTLARLLDQALPLADALPALADCDDAAVEVQYLLGGIHRLAAAQAEGATLDRREVQALLRAGQRALDGIEACPSAGLEAAA